MMSPDPSQAASAQTPAETDADLLVYMTLSADDPAGAAAAWEEFYRRHVGYLHAVCLRAFGDLLGGPSAVGDLVADTFKRVYENADKFDPAGITDPQRLRLRVRAWLGRIAQRLAWTALRGRRQLPTRLLGQDHWQQIARPPAAAPRGDPARTDRVRAALGSLTDREQHVIRVTLQWYQPESDHQRLPNDVAADLAATLRTTPENLRQIRRRAMNKLRALLSDEDPRERTTR